MASKRCIRCAFARFNNRQLACRMPLCLDPPMQAIKWLMFFLFPVVASCAAKKPLAVNTFMLRDQSNNQGSIDPMIRNEKLSRLHGAATLEERKQRLGQYFTIRWHEKQHLNSPATILFEYQQGNSGSTVKTYRQDFPPFTKQGVVEFPVIGDDYFENGKVLAWRATLLRGQHTIATRKSYLWQ